MTDTPAPGIALVLDCADPERLAAFWAPALGYVHLGARRVQDEHLHEYGTTWILMADPEGNEFCICDGGAAGDSSASAPPA